MKKICSALFVLAVTFVLAACVSTGGLPKPKVGASEKLVGEGANATIVRTVAVEQPYSSGDTIDYLKVVEIDPKTHLPINTSINLSQGKTWGRAIVDDIAGAGIVAGGGFLSARELKPMSILNQAGASSTSGASASSSAGASATSQ